MQNLSIWSVWDRDDEAISVREQLDDDTVLSARASAMARDLRELRRRVKLYKRAVESARRSGDLEALTAAKKVRDLSQRVLNASATDMRLSVDVEEMTDSKSRARDPLISYEYDAYHYRMGQRSVKVSDQLRDAAFPPVLHYSDVASLFPMTQAFIGSLEAG